MLNNDKNELSFSLLWNILKKCWIKIVIVAVIAAMATGLVTHFMIQKKYSSSITFYVVNSNVNYDYTTTSLLSATEQLANDYINIICSDVMMIPLSEHLKEEHQLNYSATELKKKISTSTKEDSSFFFIKITDVNKDHAYTIATCISELAPQVIKDIVKADQINSEKEIADCVKVIEQPKLDTAHDSPSLLRNVAVAVLLSAVIVYAVFFFITLNDTVIKTEEDVKKYTSKYPLIGVIPSWENA